MKMYNRIYIAMLLVLLSVAGHPQNMLQSPYNIMRGGDDIIMLGIKCNDIGPSGKDIIWNLSETEASGEQFLIKHVVLNENSDTIARIEKGSVHYFILHNDSTLLYGKENNQSSITFDTPETYLLYPFKYGDSILTEEYGCGKYCDNITYNIHTVHGVKADAYGTLILPDNDTLLNVLRTIETRETEYIHQDSIVYTRYESAYRWYASGYRYPVLIAYVSEAGMGTSVDMCYSPLDRQEYISDDPLNEVMRAYSYSSSYGHLRQPDITGNIAYKISLDERNVINVTAHSRTSGMVCYSLYSVNGMILYERNCIMLPGLTSFSIDAAHLKSGVYILDMEIGDCRITEKVILH